MDASLSFAPTSNINMALHTYVVNGAMHIYEALEGSSGLYALGVLRNREAGSHLKVNRKTSKGGPVLFTFTSNV